VITVTLSYPDGQQEEILLLVVPRRGEFIRTDNGPGTPPLVVESVMHVEGNVDPPDPRVIIGVRPRAEGPP
jgi:hypothetical protein